MRRLSHKDSERASAFLPELYAEVRSEHLPKVMLDGLARLIPCEHSGYNEIDATTNSALIEMQPIVPDVARLAPVLESHFSKHPQLNYYRCNADRTPYQFTDFMPHRAFRERGIYRDFYRHVDTEHQLACVLSESGATCDIGISINRKHKAFSERDRTVLEFLRPHLIQARQNAIAFTALDRKITGLNSTIEELQTGIVTLDSNGHMTWITALAARLLESYFPGSLKNSKHLPGPISQWVAKCRSLFEIQLIGAQPGTFNVTAGSSTLQIRYAPEPGKRGRLLLTEQKGAMTQAGYTEAFGFSAREADVMHWMVEGKTSPEIGAILGISPRTVHKHVERIFSKLNVQSRTAAIRQILRGPDSNP